MFQGSGLCFRFNTGFTSVDDNSVKVVCGNGELKMGVYTSAFNKKECVGEKGEDGSEERSAHPQKIKGRFF